MGAHLLDANVLIALTLVEHEHHEAARRWVAGVDTVAICPVVEGALVRALVRLGEPPAVVASILGQVRARPGCEFWPDDVSYADVDLSGLQGHRQVTDAYLVALASAHGGVLATFDKALAKRAGPGAILIPTSYGL
ncbi:VapC toxin family PIN domain ribonuclease [Xylanimonas oleitrophica]|uniref:Ribonuclease VapC n=1 Tax=Xylanimonas oleitrophica TaxID=2607479 RepID=A0A2W5WU22_9MICO|nr:VapC toxin family PIN domain ribonuclease [Xylanimonas oleitrophica]